MEELGNCKVLVTIMDNAFSDYSHQAEKLSVLLAEPRDQFSWTLYHDLLKQRTAEVAAYEKYRNLKDELFTLIHPPTVPDRPESSVN
jgi:dsDNA-binding SOS-regulon protein